MVEIKGNLWDFFGANRTCVLITTNGFVKANGEAVMGRGCAKEAVEKFGRKLAKKLGDKILANGNIIHILELGLATFPVKHKWWEKADPVLIRLSATRLKQLAYQCPAVQFILPRPGCGNGGLKWDEIKHLLRDLPDNVKVISKPEEE